MTPAEDEDMIEALPTDGADPVLRDGVRPRGADGRLHSREAFGPQDLIEEPENLASRSRSSRCLSSRRPVIDRFRACWVDPGQVGPAVRAGDVDPSGGELDEEQDVQRLQEHRLDREEDGM